MSVEEKLKNLIIERFDSVKRFSNEIGIKYTTLDTMLKKNIGNAGVSNVIKICRALNIDIDALAEGRIEPKRKIKTDLTFAEDSFLSKYRSLSTYDRETLLYLTNRILNRIPETQIIKEEPLRYITRPAYMISPSAGTGQWLPDDLPMVDIPVPDTPETEKADFILKVFGKSMEPKYKDGDLVLVKKADAVDIGKVGIFVVNGEALIKECRDGILHSINQNYGDIILEDNDTVHCLGEVIGTLNKKGIILNKTQ